MAARAPLSGVYVPSTWRFSSRCDPPSLVHGQVQRAAQREGAAAIGVGGKPIECPVLIRVSDDETHKDDGMPLPDAPGAPRSHWFKKPRLPSKPTG